MSSMVQIRNVPGEIHRKLKSRAALVGMSLSDYLLLELRRGLDRPTREELLARISHRAPVISRQSPAAMVRRERDRR
jgi:plasmid stability protein